MTVLADFHIKNDSSSSNEYFSLEKNNNITL